MLHRIHHNKDKNSHHGQKIDNKSTKYEGKKNGDHKHPSIDLYMEIERVNHRDVGKGTQKTRTNSTYHQYSNSTNHHNI